MAQVRKPFQGVLNIIRFNWHFYLLSAVLVLLIYILNYFLMNRSIWGDVICILIITLTIFSLLVSWYVYDLSELYTLNWLDVLNGENGIIVNIHAGFDETSILLKERYSPKEFVVLDFYNLLLHTEVSIKRARKIHLPFPGTKQVTTARIPLPDNCADKIFVIFAAHEIRQEQERILFFSELKRVIKPEGKIVITEHLRNIPNFVAYNIGFFHFLSKSSWASVFKAAKLNITKQIKHPFFVTTFILEKNGTTS